MSGVKSTFHMMATTIGGSTMGMMNSARMASRNRRRLFNSRAAASPSSNWKPTVKTDRRSCTPREPRNR